MLTPSKTKHQPQLLALRVWWRTQSRALQRRLLLLTAIIMLLSTLLLLHCHNNNANATNNTTQPVGIATLAKAGDDGVVSTAQLSGGSSGSNKQADINLTPPLSRATLGHATWSMLHTMAALFPEDAPIAKQASVRSFLFALGDVYPCATCARHFRAYLAAHPLPPVGQLNRTALSKWLCGAHNAVDVRLEKATLDCAAVMEKWPPVLQQDCGCGSEEEEEEADQATGKDAPADAAFTRQTDASGEHVDAANQLAAGREAPAAATS